MISIKNFNMIDYMEFPTGRRTRVMVGKNGAIKGSHFCQGLVEILPGGCIPPHEHKTVETYTILKGTGTITVDGETELMTEGDFIFIDSSKKHSFRNTGNSKLLLMFCYSPQIVVDHWARELNQSQINPLSSNS